MKAKNMTRKACRKSWKINAAHNQTALSKRQTDFLIFATKFINSWVWQRFAYFVHLKPCSVSTSCKPKSLNAINMCYAKAFYPLFPLLTFCLSRLFDLRPHQKLYLPRFSSVCCIISWYDFIPRFSSLHFFLSIFNQATEISDNRISLHVVFTFHRNWNVMEARTRSFAILSLKSAVYTNWVLWVRYKMGLAEEADSAQQRNSLYASGLLAELVFFSL